jgi:hypothetical protein
MASISLSLTMPLQGFRISDFVTGAAAPTAGSDIELRMNTTDQLSNPITLTEVQNALKAFTRITFEQHKCRYYQLAGYLTNGRTENNASADERS